MAPKVAPVVADGGVSPDSDGKVERLLKAAEVLDLNKQLLKAAEHGRLEEVKELLESNANIEAKGVFLKQTPLHFAARRGHRDIVHLLLEKKADIEAKDDYQETPLHLAAEFGHRDIVDLLLDKKAQIEATNAKQETPLHAAAARWDRDIVDFAFG